MEEIVYVDETGDGGGRLRVAVELAIAAFVRDVGGCIGVRWEGWLSMAEMTIAKTRGET